MNGRRIAVAAVVTMALVGDLLPPRRRVAALGLVGAVDTLGWVLGPLWGAAIVALFHDRTEPWRLVFYVNIPLGIAAAIAIATTTRGLGASRLTGGIRRLDVLGAFLLAIGLGVVFWTWAFLGLRKAEAAGA